MKWEEEFEKWWNKDRWKLQPIDKDDLKSCIQSLLSQQKASIVGALKQLNLRSQKDAVHCNCLPHAIWVIEGKDEEAKEILKELEQEQEIVDIIINEIEGKE